MAASTQSFIDIAALDCVRRHFAAGDSVVILTTDLTQVIWANGAGAALLGFPGIEAAIGADSGLGRSARRQIEATPGYPDIGSDRPITVRLAVGLISQITAFRASRLMLPGNEPAIMLIVPFAGGATRSEDEIARRAISGFDEPGNYLALLDASGRPLAATPGFDDLGMTADDVSRLVTDLATQDERLVKRIVRVASHAMPIGLARLTDDPATHLLITVDERRMASGPVDAPVVVDDSQSSVVAPKGDTATRTAPGPLPYLPDGPDDLPRPARTAPGEETVAPGRQQSISQAAAATTIATMDETPEAASAYAADGEPIDAASQPGTSDPAGETDVDEPEAGPEQPAQHDEWYFSDTAQKTGQETPAQASAHGSGDDATRMAAADIDRSAAPVRFVWRTDANGLFTSISSEFVTAVGEASGDIVGESFAQASRRLGFDPHGEIAALLERRDTWSGRSVLWPIAGSQLVAPVDLAALPAYDRERRFEGFRGFGVVRPGDAVVDPRRTGLSLTDEAGGAKKAAFESPEGVDAADPFRGEVPVLELTSKPSKQRYSDKVIRLAEHRTPASEKGLSTLERSAFREIGEHLKRASGDTPLQEAPEHPLPDADTVRSDDAVATLGDENEASPQYPAKPDDVREETPPEVLQAVAEGEEDGPTTAVIAGIGNDTPPAQPSDTEAGRAAQRHESAAAPDAMDDQSDAIDDQTAPSDLPRSGVGGRDEDGVSGEANAASSLPERVLDETGSTVGGGAVIAGDDASAPVGEAAQADPSIEAAGDRDVAEVKRQSYASRSLFDFVDRGANPAVNASSAAGEPAGGTATERFPLAQGGFLPSAFAERRADTSILAQLPIPVLVHSGDTLHYANEAFFQLTGYADVGDLAAHGGLDALLPGPAADRRQGDNRVILRNRDGSEIPVAAFLQSVPWMGGRALLLTLTRQPGPTNAPDAATQEKELEARVAELRTILDTATDGVVLIDNDGMVRSISRPAEALFGYDGEQIVGKPFTALFAIESQRSAQDYLSGLSGNGVASVLNDGREVIGREAQGRFIPLFMTIGRLPGDSGYCAVLRDITQWKKAEEDLTQARAQAERTSSQKSDFLARVSHEIRTPLNAIIGFSELMIDEKFGPIANDRYRDYLRDINRSGNHVLDLVNDLLDISKIEAGQQEMDYEAISLNDALTETVAMMQPQANRERVIIRSSFASKLPEVVADLRSVRQIALNILSNAVRYTQAGGQVIVSTAYEPNGEVVMRVRDTGIGMSQSEIEQALKPFKQVNALKRARGDGTGLGLPLTKAMVEANRAKFAIYSTPGEGTLVEVTFPSTRVLAG